MGVPRGATARVEPGPLAWLATRACANVRIGTDRAQARQGHLQARGAAAPHGPAGSPGGAGREEDVLGGDPGHRHGRRRQGRRHPAAARVARSASRAGRGVRASRRGGAGVAAHVAVLALPAAPRPGEHRLRLLVHGAAARASRPREREGPVRARAGGDQPVRGDADRRGRVPAQVPAAAVRQGAEEAPGRVRQADRRGEPRVRGMGRRHAAQGGAADPRGAGAAHQHGQRALERRAERRSGVSRSHLRPHRPGDAAAAAGREHAAHVVPVRP